MPRIEKGFGERSTDDIVRDILREYSNRENPISAKNIEGIAKRKGVEIGRNAVKGFANRIGARSYETEEECDAIIEECQEIEREIVFEKKGPSGRTIGYWMMETISESEWMFLLDSVLNSKILTNKGAKNLAKRITFLAGKNFSELTKYRHRMENQPYDITAAMMVSYTHFEMYALEIEDFITAALPGLMNVLSPFVFLVLVKNMTLDTAIDRVKSEILGEEKR